MRANRESIEEAVERVREKLAESIAPDEPGAVILVTSRGESVAAVSAGVASLVSRSPLTLDTPFDTGSVAKVVTGLAVAILEEEEALSPSMRLRDLLPEFPSYGDTLRVGHLIHHESGLRNYFSLLYFMAGWHPCLPPSADEVFETLCRAGSLTFEPGSRYAYCDSNYFLLARIVERVTGRLFGAFVQSRILDPLGMESSRMADIGAGTAFDSVPARVLGYVNYAMELRSTFEQRIPETLDDLHPVQFNYRHVGAEGFYSSAADLSRLARQTLEPSLVSAQTMRERILAAPRMRDDGLGYAYGLNVGTYRGRQFVGHDGQIWGYSASLAVFPDEDLEIVCLTNRSDLGAWNLRSAVLDALEGRHARPFFGRPEPAPRVLRRYLDPATSRFVDIVEDGGGQAVSICGGAPVSVEIEEDGSLRGGGMSIVRLPTCSEQAPLLVREADGDAGTFQPFDDAGGRATFLEYSGSFHCADLATTFDVEAVETGIRLRNRDRRRPSMDLDYAPTIRDFFWSHDPYPELSQIQFLRERGAVHAFVYRDPDGDRREDFRFVRIAG